LPVRHLELMGLAVRYWSPQIGVGWINDEYFDGHVRWFRKWADVYNTTDEPRVVMRCKQRRGGLG